MAVTDTGYGSPVAASETGEAGHGSPVRSTLGDTGHGSPVVYSTEAPSLAMSIRRAFQSDEAFQRHGFDPAFSEDGGEVLEVHAAWPRRGPYKVQLVWGWLLVAGIEVGPGPDPSVRVTYPSETEGCYSVVAGMGDAVYTNASQKLLRCAMPRLPRGTYNLLVSWDGGSATLERALRVVPRVVPRETWTLLRAPALGSFLERRR